MNETSTATAPTITLLGDLQVTFDDEMTDCKGTMDPPNEQKASEELMKCTPLTVTGVCPFKSPKDGKTDATEGVA